MSANPAKRTGRRALWLAGGLALLLGAAVGWLATREEPFALEEVSDPATSRPAAPQAPNVVLVIACTVRQDQVTPYGASPANTPFLAELASQGAIFLDPIASSSWTKESSTAILTGFDAASIGAWDRGGGLNKRRMAPAVTTLAEHLRAGGWQTLGLVTNPNLVSLFGFAQGFDRYLQPNRRWSESGMIKLGGEVAVPRALRLVAEAEPGRPFFLELLLVDAHAPYPEQAQGPFDADGAPARVAQYRTGLHRLDGFLRQLDEGLRALGHDRDDTLFLVVSDHGEGLRFPPHHGKSHGRFLFPSTVGAVWIAAGPGIPAGQRIGGLASHLDVLPTVLGLVGLGDGYAGPGLDHAPALRGQRSETARTRAFTQTTFNKADRAAVYSATHMCQQDYPSAGALPPGRCYDRESDPLFEHPFEHPLLEELRTWRADREADASRWGQGPEAAMSPELLEQLEALGYTE